MRQEQQLILGWATILGCLWVGELCAQKLPWPIPGSILGMILLLVFSFFLKGNWRTSIRSVSLGIIPFLSLAIMPASAGILNHLSLLKTEGLSLLLVLILSLILGMWATGWTYQWMSRISPKTRPKQQTKGQ